MDLNCSVQDLRNHQRGSRAFPRSVECWCFEQDCFYFVFLSLWGGIFPVPLNDKDAMVGFCSVFLIQVQYNLLTPPIGWVSGSQDSSRRTSVPLYHGFKEVEENWTKHCSSGKKEDVRNFLFRDLLL